MTEAATITVEARDRGIAVVNLGNGNVRIVIDDGSSEALLAYARELDITEAALRRFFVSLGDAPLQMAELESRLAAWVARYRRIEADLHAFSPDDTVLEADRAAALAAMAAGDLDGAGESLARARAHWQARTGALRGRADEATLIELELALGVAEVAMASFRYPEAMERFADAAGLLPRRQAKPLARALRAWGMAEAEFGRFAEAHAHLIEAAALDPEASPLARTAELSLAQAARELGRHGEAETRLRALARDVQSGSAERLAAEIELAATLRETGAFERARAVVTDALDEPTATAGAASARIRLLREDARLLDELGEVDRALAQMTAASCIAEATLAPAHPLARRVALDHAGLLRRAGRLAEAEMAYARLEEQGAAALGPDHPELVTILDHLGTLALDQGHFAVAHAQLARGKALAERTIATSGHHADHAQTLNNLGRAELGLGRPDAALELFDDADFILRKALGAGHKDRATVIANRAQAQFARDSMAEALADAETALQLREAALGPRHPDVAESLATLGAFCHQLEQPDRAQDYLARARVIYEALLPSQAPALARTLFNEASLALDQGHPAAAAGMAARAREFAATSLGSCHPFIVQIEETQGVSEALAGDPAAARTTLARAYATATTLWPEEHSIPSRIAAWQARLAAATTAPLSADPNARGNSAEAHQ